MAYTTPVLASVGQVVTAAFWNAEIQSQWAATFGNSPGTLIHERGGVELDISAITTGGILHGASSGTIAILTAFTTAAGLVTHEYGGMELDISSLAKGVIFSKSGTSAVAGLAAGTNGQNLVADSGETTGLKWANNDTVTKTGSATTVNNSTTLVNVTDQSFSAEANKEYILEIFFDLTNASGANDSKFKLSVPSGCAYEGQFIGNNAALQDVDFMVDGGQTTQRGPGSNGYRVFRARITNGANAGTVQMQFAQLSAEAFDHVVLAGALVRVRESA